jgi:hypothetical protein
MADKAEVWLGTLSLMVLRTLATMGPQHGYGLARRIERISGERLSLNYGTLYPALIKGSHFHNGTIEVELAGKPAASARPGARGFIGIAFRVQGNSYEYIYLRPTNGRADDQIRRNHSTQYGAQPDFDFDRLRKESPEKYESYVDLEPGVWTKYRIVIEGTKARLFVHGAVQPCLIVNDMKLGDSEGTVAQ